MLVRIPALARALLVLASAAGAAGAQRRSAFQRRYFWLNSLRSSGGCAR